MVCDSLQTVTANTLYHLWVNNEIAQSNADHWIREPVIVENTLPASANDFQLFMINSHCLLMICDDVLYSIIASLLRRPIWPKPLIKPAILSFWLSAAQRLAGGYGLSAAWTSCVEISDVIYIFPLLSGLAKVHTSGVRR